MTDTEFDAEAYIQAVAPALGLDIGAARRPQVATFLTIARGMAEILDRAPVPEPGIDLAPVFDPGAGEKK